MFEKKRIISLLFIMIAVFGTSLTSAATFYRHPPFSMEITRDDKLVVNYDYQDKKGIDCQANSNHVVMDFQYKGHKKADFLPLYLQNKHVPHNESEVLADQKGQFTLYIDQSKTRADEVRIHCDYIA